MGKTYMGRVVAGKVERVWFSDTSRKDDFDGTLLPAINVLNLSLDFDWGNESPGAQQLAVTILNDYRGPDVAKEQYEAFTREVIAKLNHGRSWFIEEETIVKFLQPNLGDLSSDSFEIQEEALDRLRESHGFDSRWSLYDQTDLEEDLPFAIKELRYQGFTVGFPENFEEVRGFPPCWMDLWRAAELLYQLTGKGDHIYIEEFTEIEDGIFELEMGS